MSEAVAVNEDVLENADENQMDVYDLLDAPEAAVTKSSKNAVKNSAALAQAGLQKIVMIGREIEGQFHEREAEVKSLLLGILSAKNVLFLGKPGTGKSDMTRTFASHVTKATYFEWLLGRTSDPSELLGPISVKGLEKDRFFRKSEGKLPEANFAFVDEIFKANSAVLNTLLPILNERVWFNDGQIVPTNLKMVVGASNEFPEDEDLNAFFDRFIFRHWVEYIGDAQNQFNMLKESVARRANPAPKTHTMITLEEIEAVQETVNQVAVPDGTITAFQKLIYELKKKAIEISDRRLNICIQVMQANAALDGRTSADPDDMEPLAYVLWEKKEDIEEIRNQIVKMMNPFKDKVNTAYKEALDIQDKVMNTQDPTDRANAAIDARTVLDQVAKKIKQTMNEAQKEGRDITEFNKKLQEVIQINTDIVNKCLMFDMDSIGSSDSEQELPF